ncbi:MAG: protein translocase subunit SecF [Hydrogenophilaceae bacterium]|jgi:preprotein translocase SecF subunit|nr:protein translocase subunit SecF [Hydrogenophilaceae bacterium]
MKWPLIRNLPNETKFTYVKFAGFAAFLSIAAVLATFTSVLTGGFRENPIAIYQNAEGSPLDKAGAVLARGFNLGIDFKGGTSMIVAAPEEIDLEALRGALSAMQLGDVQVQETTGPRDDASNLHYATLRYESPSDARAAIVASQVENRVEALIPDSEVRDRQVVGPKVSGELFSSGLIALGLAILLMLIYIWFRFEWQFGLGAVLALFHDVILTLGLFSIFRLEFTLTIIAALLTIIGYSMNDTVVVFDRIRENLRKFKKMPLGQVIDLSLNQTLSRTIITGCTALLALGGLLYIGGEALSGFAIAMIFGIVIGTYSSLYVAAPAILIWGVRRGGESEASQRSRADLAENRP